MVQIAALHFLGAAKIPLANPPQMVYDMAGSHSRVRSAKNIDDWTP